MLTDDEIDYLNKIPINKKALIYPFNSKITSIADDIADSIIQIYPDLEVRHMGASALKISGQNDIDIYAFSDPKDFKKYLPGLVKIFGKPVHKYKTFCEWKFKKDGIDVEFYLSEKNSKTMQRQIEVFETLKNNQNLLREYESLKLSMNGKSFKEYQKKKYKFYHKILNE